MEFTYKERLRIKSYERINRLTNERMKLQKNSPDWQTKSRQIGQEKEFIKHLRDGSVNIDRPPEWKGVNATV